MSIEKLSDSSRVIVESTPFTMIPNSVIGGIKDNDTFRLYCLLASKSRDWKVVKEFALKACGIGQRKGVQCWSYMQRCSLIRYEQRLDKSGKFLATDIIVTSGLDFDHSVEFLPEKSRKSSNTGGALSASAETACAVTAAAEKAQLLNKEIRKKEEKRKSSYATATAEKQTATAVTNTGKREGAQTSAEERRREANKRPPDCFKPPMADVTKQSTSFNPDRFNAPLAPMNPLLAEFMAKMEKKTHAKSGRPAYREETGAVGSNKGAGATLRRTG